MTTPDPKHTDEQREPRLAALGHAIRTFRRSRDLTQAELGDLLANEAGEATPQTTISRWEVGAVDLGVEQLRQIETVLDLPLGTLGRAAGYVVPAVDDAATPVSVRSCSDVIEVAACLRAAATLGLDVLVGNHHEGRETDEPSRGWTVTLYRPVGTRT